MFWKLCWKEFKSAVSAFMTTIVVSTAILATFLALLVRDGIGYTGLMMYGIVAAMWYIPLTGSILVCVVVKVIDHYSARQKAED